MPLKQFDLGQLRLGYQRSETTLHVTCSSVLDLPTSIGDDITLDELVRLTTNGELWIAKATVCRMDATASISSRPGGTSPDLDSLVGAISGCPIWTETGITLRREHTGAPQDGTNRLSFIVNHPNLFSESLAPRDIACAKFVTVSFEFHLEETTAKQKKKGKNGSRAWTNHAPTHKAPSEAKSRYKLRSRIRKVDYAESSDGESMEFGISSDELAAPRHGTAETKLIADGKLDGARGSGQPETDLDLLVRAAYHKFLGVKKISNGVRVHQDLDGPSLVDIAPAVWNLRYLQAFADRADHMSLISSCLSGLNAESPSLRMMATRLSETSVFGGGKREVQARLHMLVHRGLEVSRDATFTLAAGVAKPAGKGVPKAEPEPGSTGGIELQHNSNPQVTLTSDADDGLRWEDTMMHGYQLDARGLLDDDAGADSSQMIAFDETTMFDVDINAELQQEDELDTERSSYPGTPEDLDYYYLQDEGIESGHESPTRDRQEWLDLSQASLVMDENGQRIPFDELDDGDYSYQLVPL